MRRLNVKTMLQGLLWDADNLLRQNQVRQAFNVLKKKIGQIERYDSAEYQTMDWDEAEEDDIKTQTVKD